MNDLLLNAADYQDFLRKAFVFLKSEKASFSYSSFAKKAGLSAKSFPREVAFGSKRLTLSSGRKFSVALGLKGDYRKYFELLVMAKHEDTRPPGRTELDINEQLLKTKQVILRASQNRGSSNTAHFFKLQSWVEVYASLGTAEKGASISEIVAKSKLPEARCREVVLAMCEQGIAQEDSKSRRFKAVSFHQTFGDLGADEFFKRYYMQNLSKLKSVAGSDFASTDSLFHCSVFSLRSRDLPVLRKKLRNLIEGFVDTTERGEGDKLARVVVGFF